MTTSLSRCSVRAWFGALFFLLLSIVVRGEAASSARPTVEATKLEITKLLNDFLTFNGDPAQHDRFWAADLVYTSSGGIVKTKPEIMQGMKTAQPVAAKATSAAAYSAEDVLVRVYGDTAALTFRLVARYPNGHTATFRNSGTLLHRSGQWQVVTWQATKEPTEAK